MVGRGRAGRNRGSSRFGIAVGIAEAGSDTILHDMRIRAVLIDMDGTIWESPVDWSEVRRAVGVPRDSRTIIDHLEGLPPAERTERQAILHRFEAEGAEGGWITDGTRELLAHLRERGIHSALVTNNSARSAETVLARHPLPFDLVATREDNPMKPDPAAFLEPLRRLGVPPEAAAVVGDSHLDLLAAIAAGIPTVILVAPKVWARVALPEGAGFHEVRDLHEVVALLDCLGRDVDSTATT